MDDSWIKIEEISEDYEKYLDKGKSREFFTERLSKVQDTLLLEAIKKRIYQKRSDGFVKRLWADRENY